MRRPLSALAILTLAACSPAKEESKKTEAAEASPAVSTATPADSAPTKTDAPKGAYTLDKAHASLDFRVNHIGFSNYTARFSNFDALLQFDPENPAASSISATVDARSLLLPTPPAGFLDELLGDKWLNAVQFGQMTFKSTKIELTGANTAKITGDFTMRGQTLPVTLDATFNGGYAGNAYEPQARIGFSARGSLQRSAFGISIGLPPPGTKMGVSENVDIIIEAEFNGPPLKDATPVAPGK